MARLVQGIKVERYSAMTKKAQEAVDALLARLAEAYSVGRDSVAFAGNVREEARDQLIDAMSAMCVRRHDVGQYRIYRFLDDSRTLNIDKVKRLLGDKAEKLQFCYDKKRRYSIHVYYNRQRDLAKAARDVRRVQDDGVKEAGDGKRKN
jgi:hypothetical protein